MVEKKEEFKPLSLKEKLGILGLVAGLLVGGYVLVADVIVPAANSYHPPYQVQLDGTVRNTWATTGGWELNITFPATDVPVRNLIIRVNCNYYQPGDIVHVSIWLNGDGSFDNAIDAKPYLTVHPEGC